MTRTEVVEVPRRQYVPLPPDLTAGVTLPPKPQPKCVQNNAPTLCNGQLVDYVDLLLAFGEGLNDRLAAIRKIEAEAIAP